MMQLTKKPWAVCLISAALLGGLSVSAQTAPETQPVTDTDTQPVTVTVTATDATTTTDPQTSPSRSFTTDLAKASLAKDDGTEPTTEASIQEQRDSGMGWGQIANSLGLRLGAVVSAANRAQPVGAQNSANANKPTEAGQKSQSAAASSRSGNGAGNSGGKGGGNSGGGRGK